MSMKEIDKAKKKKCTKAYATRGSVYTIHKYLLTYTSNTFEINLPRQAWGTKGHTGMSMHI